MRLQDMNDTLKRYDFKCLCGQSLKHKEFKCYPHEGGIKLTNFEYKVWLFVECNCGYQMSFSKLDVQLKDLIKKDGWNHE